MFSREMAELCYKSRPHPQQMLRYPPTFNTLVVEYPPVWPRIIFGNGDYWKGGKPWRKLQMLSP